MINMSIRHDRDLRYQKSRERSSRPKTFKSEESAKIYADKEGIKKYQLENLKSAESKTKKLRMIL